MADTDDLILIEMLRGNLVQGTTLTVKGFVKANLVSARVAIEELPKPLTEDDLKALLHFIKSAEDALPLLEEIE